MYFLNIKNKEQLFKNIKNRKKDIHIQNLNRFGNFNFSNEIANDFLINIWYKKLENFKGFIPKKREVIVDLSSGTRAPTGIKARSREEYFKLYRSSPRYLTYKRNWTRDARKKQIKKFGKTLY